MSTHRTDRLARTTRAAVAASAIAAGLAWLAPCAAASAATDRATLEPDVLGDPVASAEHWQIQTLDDSCVLMSVASVVGDLTGDLPSEREMVRLAGRTPSVAHDGVIYALDDDISGTMMPDALTLLDHYGIDAGITDAEREAESGIETGLDALADYLAAGSGVIVSLNSDTIWGTDGDRSYANHAVAVTGFDPDAGIVYLNDSAFPGGDAKEVPVKVFEKAWRTSDYRLIVTD